MTITKYLQEYIALNGKVLPIEGMIIETLDVSKLIFRSTSLDITIPCNL